MYLGSASSASRIFGRATKLNIEVIENNIIIISPVWWSNKGTSGAAAVIPMTD